MGNKILQKKCPLNILNIFKDINFISIAGLFFNSFCDWAYFILKKIFKNFGHPYLGQKTAGEATFASPVGPRHT